MYKGAIQTNRTKSKDSDDNAQVLISRDDIDRLYVSRKQIERRLTSIEDFIDGSTQNIDE